MSANTLCCNLTCKGEALMARVNANEPAATVPVSITCTAADCRGPQLSSSYVSRDALHTACAMSDDFSSSSSRALMFLSTFCKLVSQNAYAAVSYCLVKIHASGTHHTHFAFLLKSCDVLRQAPICSPTNKGRSQTKVVCSRIHSPVLIT